MYWTVNKPVDVNVFLNPSGTYKQLLKKKSYTQAPTTKIIAFGDTQIKTHSTIKTKTIETRVRLFLSFDEMTFKTNYLKKFCLCLYYTHDNWKKKNCLRLTHYKNTRIHVIGGVCFKMRPKEMKWNDLQHNTTKRKFYEASKVLITCCWWRKIFCWYSTQKYRANTRQYFCV